MAFELVLFQVGVLLKFAMPPVKGPDVWEQMGLSGLNQDVGR